jgi:hypothetical protein
MIPVTTIQNKNSQMTTQGTLPENIHHNTASSGRNHVAYFGGNKFIVYSKIESLCIFNRSVSSGSKKNNYTL